MSGYRVQISVMPGVVLFVRGDQTDHNYTLLSGTWRVVTLMLSGAQPFLTD